MSRAISFPGGLRKAGSEDPTYWLEVAVDEDDQEARRTWVAVSVTALISWQKMKAAIFLATNVIPSLETPKRVSQQEHWETVVNTLTATIKEEEAPPEASEAGVTLEMVYEWVASRPLADTTTEFEHGNRRYETPGGLTVFRARDLRQHLEAKRHMPEPRVLWATLAAEHFGSGVQKVDGHPYRVWWVRTDQLGGWIRVNRRTATSPNGQEAAPVTPLYKERVEKAFEG